MQTLPSSQALTLATWLQPDLAPQLSAVHALPSSQAVAAPGKQTPPQQPSPWVQTLPSSQGAGLPGLAVNALKSQPLPHALTQLSAVQGLPSLQISGLPVAQLPPLQASPRLQTSPSSQASELATWTQPGWPLMLPGALPLGSQLSVVQALPSSQTLAAPGLQLPPAQASSTVQTLPSLQTAKLLRWRQPALPLRLPGALPLGSQLSSVHGLPSSQLTIAPDLQAPPLHASPPVQGSSSPQGSALFAWTQPQASPVLPDGSQLSLVHGLASSQAVLAPGRQILPEQLSPMVQTLPSSQAAVLAWLTQPPGLPGSLGSPLLQLSSVQGLPSLQPRATPGLQALPLQASPTVHGSPSSQGALLGVETQPSSTVRASAVHGLPSSHDSADPGLHEPVAQTSPLVQALLSVHNA